MTRRLLLPAIAVMAAPPVHAHGSLAGVGGFYAGASHPLLAGEHLLLLAALGLALGRQSTRALRLSALVIAVALAAGLGLRIVGLAWPAAPFGILIGAALAGAALALALPTPVPAALTLAAFAGVGIGLDTDVPGYAAYCGVLVGALLIALNAAALAAATRQSLPAVTVRVAGSWIAAAAVMVLAFQARQWSIAT